MVMKKNISISQIDKLTRNTDKQLMQMLISDLDNFRGKKTRPAQSTGENKQAA